MRSSLLGLALLVLPMLAPVWGCAGPDEPPDEDGGEAVLHCDVSGLDLGTVVAGQRVTGELTLSNAGDDLLLIGEVTVDGPSDPPVFHTDWPGGVVALRPGDAVVVTVAFEPLTRQDYDAWLIVESNDPVSSPNLVELTGRGIAPVLRLTPTSVDFGDVEIGCSRDRSITLRNDGTLPLVLDDIVFEASSDELSATIPDTTGDVLPSESVTITVSYAPRDDMADTSYLYVYGNDLQTPVGLVTQTGTAHYPDPVVDEFEQTNAAVDILWVLDSSCSMSSVQESLEDNFASFIGILTAFDIDYHVAAMAAESSTFRGAVPFMTPSTPDPYGTFIDMVSVGTSGSHGQALLQSWNALHPPAYESGSHNYGFLRDEANLYIVYISDKDEYSPDPVPYYVTRLQALKDDPDMLRIGGVTGQEIGCSSEFGAAQPSPRFEQAISATDGISTSLCASAWIDALFEQATWGLRSGFGLSQTPMQDTIEVAVNGVATFAGWRYDADRESIVFESGWEPEFHDIVTVTYSPVSHCQD